MCQAGEIPPQARVVLLVTGNGLKDVEGAMKALDHGPISIDKDPQTLRSTLESLLKL